MLDLVLTAVLWPASVEQHCSVREQDIIIGVAYKADGSFLYCEMINKPDEHQLHIDYLKDNKIFATKTLSYSNNPLMPEVNQEDFRSGELRQSINNKQKLLLKYQANSHKKLSITAIDGNKVDAADAGFDNFIRQHWNEITTGSIVSVNFASISHQKVLPLRISSQPVTKCLEKWEMQSQPSCFLVEIDNALLRLILGNIKLTYDEQHRLQKFEGIVNINDDKEDTQKAVINYFYKSDYQKDQTKK